MSVTNMSITSTNRFDFLIAETVSKHGGSLQDFVEMVPYKDTGYGCW